MVLNRSSETTKNVLDTVDIIKHVSTVSSVCTGFELLYVGVQVQLGPQVVRDHVHGHQGRDLEGFTSTEDQTLLLQTLMENKLASQMMIRADD